ncbi:uncharacterized protein LOC132062174 [Lycium ferocissimum]|uniref:uncharacterized protein LOC132062174 n=1 Tax=Lycium ferocissimum TaxID=112874 RepID=UPI002815FB00|nr:uncharacterized protein LOC132062174 [Lycium ferocissimum]
MDFGGGYCPKRGKNKGNHFPGVKIGLNQDALLIIKLPDSRALRIMSRSLFLAMVLLILPSIGSILRGSIDVIDVNCDERDFNMLHNLFRDLADEGLVKKSHKGLFLSSENDHLVKDLDSLNVNVVDPDMDNENSIPNETFDFVIASTEWNSKFVDRVLKIGGIVVTQLSNDPLAELKALANYRIVYIRRFDKTMVGIRKIGILNDELNSRKKDILCGTTPEAKKVALKGLEDVLLEPPKRAMLKSFSRKMKFLPELLGDSLESYPRRVFVSDEKNGVAEWFKRNYPANDQDFEIYNLDVNIHESDESEKGVALLGAAEWLSKNVKEEDYVVMKAEAEVVEEMIKKKTICLVDELFLHCKNQLEVDNDDDDEEENGSQKRAYWQCLTLYGKLIDEGVAVHQWWS